MKKTILAIVITILISGMSINSISSIQIKQSSRTLLHRGNTLYVGGNGSGNYSKIQDAIDNTSDGDIVFVYDDSSPYKEFITIFNSIILIGEDKNTTVIEGFKNNDVIKITTPEYVSITGFTINRSGEDNEDAGIQIYSSYHHIYGNIFSDNRKGIILEKTSHNCNIYNNYFIDNFQGIDADESNNYNFFENIFYSNRFGIVIDKVMYTKISNNTFQENGDGIFLLHEADYNEIIDNHFIGNKVEGIHVGTASYNHFYCNNFSNNDCGILLSYQSTNNLVDNNYFSKNKYGIEISWNDNLIERNLFKGNEIGIKINWGVENKIIYNNIENNDIGIYITGGSDKNSITCNNFLNSSGTFLHIYPDIFSLRNNWDKNYWSPIKGDIKIIYGKMKVVIFSWEDMWGDLQEYAIYPYWFTIDWHPAKEPYDIVV